MPSRTEPAVTEETTALAAALQAVEDVPPAALTELTVQQRIAGIVAELPAIGKDSRNEQQKFMYRSHDDVLNALNPLLAKWGVFMAPRVVKRRTGQRETRSGGVMYEVNLLVEYTIHGVGGDSIVASAWGEGTDSGDKSTNKAMTMAFKNVIAQVFAVSTAESYDTDGHTPEETTGRVRGAVSRSAAQPAFDPGVHLRPDALNGGDTFFADLAAQLDSVGPVDWHETLATALEAKYGQPDRRELTEEQQREHWIRVSNMIAKVRAENDLETFPPLVQRDGGVDVVRKAMAWAYGLDTIDGLTVWTPDESESAEDPDDIPFGPGETT